MDEFVYNEALNATSDERFKNMSRRFTREYADSNNGEYHGSQLKFDLPSISTEQGFLSLRESSISFPYVINVSSTVNLAAMKDRMVTLKCGSQGLISGCSIQMDNQTIKSINGDFENIPLTYKIISSASTDDEQNLFDSIKFAMDDTDIAYQVGAGETNGVVLKPVPGIGDTVETNAHNEGLVKRLRRTSFNPANAQTAKFTNVDRTIARRKDHIVNTDAKTITYHMIVTMPLTFLTYDLFDKFGLTKGLFMKLNVNIHSGSTSFNVAHAAGKAITNQAPVTRFGTCPFQLTNCSQSWDTTADTVITISSGIVKAGGFSNDFGMNASSFNAVFYGMRPEAEAEYLSIVPKQHIRYTQLYVASLNAVSANASFTAKVSNSTSKMRWLLIHTSLSSAVNGGANATDVGGGVCSTMNSPFSSSPTTCMKHASLTNLQILVGGKPLYETPKSYTYQMFLEEIRGANSINGGLQLGLSSGLLDQRMWEEGYGYIFIDLSRYETDNEDLVSKPLEVRATNNTLNVCDYQFYLGTEAEFTLNTASGKIEM